MPLRNTELLYMLDMRNVEEGRARGSMEVTESLAAPWQIWSMAPDSYLNQAWDFIGIRNSW